MSQSGSLRAKVTPPPPSVATSFVTDSGTSVPAANIININGGPGIVVSANPNLSNNILITPLTASYVGTVTTSGPLGQIRNLNVSIPIPVDGAISIRCNLVGVENNSGSITACGAEILATAKRNVSFSSICGTSDSTRNADQSFSSFLCRAVIVGDDLQIEVTGVTGSTINWRGIIDVVSVT